MHCVPCSLLEEGADVSWRDVAPRLCQVHTTSNIHTTWRRDAVTWRRDVTPCSSSGCSDVAPRLCQVHIYSNNVTPWRRDVTHCLSLLILVNHCYNHGWSQNWPTLPFQLSTFCQMWDQSVSGRETALSFSFTKLPPFAVSTFNCLSNAGWWLILFSHC